MKTLNLLCVGLFMAICGVSSATIINVNNDTPSPGEYDDLQNAIDAAMPGDTLYLAPTLLNYGNIVLSKQLAIIGPGYNVTGGLLGAHAVLNDIDIDDAAAGGSAIIGIRFNELSSGLSTNAISGMQVRRCIIDYRIYTSNDVWSDGIFEGNVFTDAGNVMTSTTGNGFFTCIIQNNIFNGLIYYADNCQISNNLFLGTSAGSTALLGGCDNTVFSNNIVIGRNVGSAGPTNNFFANISFDGSLNIFPNGTNFEGVDPMFTNAGVGLFSFTNDYELDAGSPGIGNGIGGDDIGVYGGDGVYRKDGEPAIPIIRSANVPGGNTVPANSTFNVNIISEAHE
ncbi:MAG: hypothetical protein KDC12_06175 [Flavobacteriales bacterium]|nr:hypothetical protein [Flavobacteriales bacterium]